MPKDTDSTIKFKADISDLKASMQEAGRYIRLANSEFKAATAGMDNWSKSADGLSAKTKQLNTILQAQKQQLGALEADYKKVVDEQGENSKGAEELKIKINNQKAAIAQTESQLNKYEQALNEVENGADDAGDAIKDAGEAAETAGNGGFTVLKGAMANLVADGISAAINGLKNFASSVLETGQAFESSMSNVAALSGATGEQLQMLEETARQYGATTQFSASEAADALGYMALAGWDAEQSSEALGGVLNLAAASGMGLAEASDMVTDYLSAFSMEADQSAYFADLLSYAQANSNTSAAQLGEAYRNCAASLNAAGQDVETVTSLLGSMANQGYKGSEAGTALTAMMRDLTAKMNNGAVTIGNTSVAVMDAEGNYRDLTDILADVEAATDGMGDAERAAALSATFTADSIRGVNLILNEGVDSAAAFEEELRNSSGSAEEMAAIMNDNLEGDLKSMNSAFEELQLSIYEGANAPLRDMVQTITGSVLPAFTDLINGVEGADTAVGEAIAGLVNKALDYLIEFAPQLINIGLSLIQSLILGIISSLPNLVATFWQISSNLISSLGEMIPQIVLAFVQVVPQIINALLAELPTFLQACITFLLAIVQAIPEVVTQMHAALPGIVQAVLDALIQAIPVILEGAIQLLNAIVEAIPVIIESLSTTLPTIIDTILNALIDALPLILDGAITLLMAIVEAIPTIVQSLGKNLPQIINRILTSLIQALPQVLQASITLLMALIDAIPTIIRALVSNLPRIIMTIIQVLIQNLPLVLDAAITLLMALIEAIPTIITELTANLPEIITAIVEGLSDGISDVFDVGVNLIEGLWNGISSMTDWVISKIQGFGESVLGGIRDFFGINSPSTLFRDEVGKWLPPGITVGFEKAMPQAIKNMAASARDMAQDIANEMAVPLDDMALSAGQVRGIQSLSGGNGSSRIGSGSNGGGGQTINFNQTINSPEPVNRLTVFRDTNSLLFSAGVRLNNV